jgi:dienelactone hydrolase
LSARPPPRYHALIMNSRMPGLLAVALFAAAPLPLAAETPAPPIELIEAAPEKGFHYPYLLRMPADPAGAAGPYLLVEPNNTGQISDDFEFHMEAARKLAANAIGAYLAPRLQVPLLVPVFPRPKEEWRIYTHQLDRDTMLLTAGPMKRLDLQLIAMIDDARARLAARGFEARREVLMTGFSASGTFVNRFVMLHPDRVRAAAGGGLNALLMIPRSSVGSTILPYPLGTADFEEVTGGPFREELWKRVPLLFYMGGEDTNDAVEFDDGYSDEEKAAVHAALGRGMKERWERSQALYRESGAHVTLRTYEKVGHWTDGTVNGEILTFFRDALACGHGLALSAVAESCHEAAFPRLNSRGW